MGPTTRLEFLGITLGSVLMQASLPQDELWCIKAIISLSTTAVLSKRDLLSLLGRLNFAMCIIPHDISFFYNDFVESEKSESE